MPRGTPGPICASERLSISACADTTTGGRFVPCEERWDVSYPKNHQTADQQLKDEDECFASAKQQSGIDPQAPPPATKTEEQKKAEQQAAADNAKQVKGGRVRGAARGAAGGAAVGAIANDEAGKGTAAGATAGANGGGSEAETSKQSVQAAGRAGDRTATAAGGRASKG